jgi:DNA invertase Pin-like site-specific DNA recombinase
MKVAIYARVSTEDKGQDTENQLIQLREFCKSRNYEIYKEYTEQITGTGKKKREVFEQMLEDARKGKFQALLVWSYDRFSRAGLSDIKYLLQLNDWNVKFISYQEPFLDTTTEMGELLIPIFAWIAKQEAKKISERTKAGLKRAVLEGKKLGRPKKQADINKIITLRNEGKSLDEIAKMVGVSKETVRRRILEMEKSSDSTGNADDHDGTS